MSERDDLLEWKARAIAAEKTVDVLKAKVCAFYNGDAQTTIQRQLARSERRQAEARRRSELIEMRAAALARQTQELEELVEKRTRDIRRIVDHVASGLLVVGVDLIVRPGFTKSCYRLFSTTDIVGRYLPDLLGMVREKDAEHLAQTLGQVFADILPEELCLDAVPRRYSIGERVLSLEAGVIREEGVVEALLLTINDITSLEAAQRKVRSNEILIGVLMQRSAFQSFVAEARALLETAAEVAAGDGRGFVRRCLHTVKGNAAAFNLFDIVGLVHEVESKPKITEQDVHTVENAIRDFLDENSRILDIAYDVCDDEVYELRGTAIDRLREDAGDPAKIDAWVNRFVLKRTDHVVAPLRQYAEKLAERLDKEVTVVVEGGDVMIDARHLRPVLQNLTHAFRNAVDHGLELPEERGDKPERGRLVLAVTEDERRWWFEVSDDGRGIDADRLTQAAIDRGLLTPAAAALLTPSDKLSLVFVDGLSSRSEVTDISGRGAGMSALKFAVERLGGFIRVESTPGVGVRVRLSIPKPSRLTRSAYPRSADGSMAPSVRSMSS